MNKGKLCASARIEMGEHASNLWLRPVGSIPEGLWSWRVYINGNVYHRGPGSKRKDPEHWYGVLFPGEYRLVVRDSTTNNPDMKGSKTLCFTVEAQLDIFVDVAFVNGEINLALSSRVA
jgi:hypothetical protein